MSFNLQIKNLIVVRRSSNKKQGQGVETAENTQSNEFFNVGDNQRRAIPNRAFGRT